jgi:hypothetical protein
MGAGMMNCNKALAACENNVEKATEFLRKKGLASAEKKAGRLASELNCLQVNLCNEISCHLCPKEKKQLFAGGPCERRAKSQGGLNDNWKLFRTHVFGAQTLTCLYPWVLNIAASSSY